MAHKVTVKTDEQRVIECAERINMHPDVRSLVIGQAVGIAVAMRKRLERIGLSDLKDEGRLDEECQHDIRTWLKEVFTRAAYDTYSRAMKKAKKYPHKFERFTSKTPTTSKTPCENWQRIEEAGLSIGTRVTKDPAAGSTYVGKILTITDINTNAELIFSDEDGKPVGPHSPFSYNKV